ncbi:MAG TPA: topoisomerase C-terminal repeat-containing protein, partial [Methylovirgula sp.]
AVHPETKAPIVAGIGRYGPYVQHGKTYANIGKDEDILSIGGNRAIDLIVAKESGLSGRRFGAEASSASRELGDHPQGGAVVIKAGRFGPYVNWGKINATLPRESDPTSVTLDDAIALLAAKAQGGGGGGGTRGRVLGQHPSGGDIVLREGRFGPYVSLGKVNATLKNGAAADSITLEDAIQLIDAKGGVPTKKKAAAKAKPAKAAPKKAAAKKTATKAPARKAKRA